MIRRLREIHREQGLRGVWFGAVARIGLYRRLELVELRLRPPPPVLEAPVALAFGFLTPAQDDNGRTRLARGDRCFAATEDGRVVSSRWISEVRAHVSYLDRWLDLDEGDAYLSETYTAPALRGQGVSGAAGTRLAAALAQEGKRRILAGVLAENLAGRRAYEKAGYVRIGRIGTVRLGRWRHDFGWPGPSR